MTQSRSTRIVVELSARQGAAARGPARAHLRAQSRFTRASSTRPASGSTRCGSRTISPAAADHQGRTGRRPGGDIRRGARSSPSRSSATRATARPRRRRDGRCAGSTRNESWQWMLECWKAVYRGARRARRRSGVLPVFVRSVPRLLGRRSKPGVRWGCTAFRAAACRASSAWR